MKALVLLFRRSLHFLHADLGTLHHYNDLYMTEYGGKSPFTVLWRKEQPARYNLSAREILSQVLDKDNRMA